MTTPERVLIAGDWHSNVRWACGVIDLLPKLLPEESPRRVVHLGDFGVWPRSAGKQYLIDVHYALQDVGGELWFVDGNHEDYWQLGEFALGRPPGSRIPLATSRIQWLTRGHRWTWHNRTWLALGGATSVDRPIRTEGRDWWPQEALTPADCEYASRAPAQVMVCHDAPASVPLDLPRPAPRWWELEPAGKHRELLQTVVDKVRPSWLLHGHYHLAHQTTVTMGHGDVQVTGLDSDGALSGNYRTLNVRTMEWETP